MDSSPDRKDGRMKGNVLIFLHQLVLLVEKLASIPFMNVKKTWIDHWRLLKKAVEDVREDKEYLEKHLAEAKLEIRRARDFVLDQGPIPQRHTVSE